MAYREIKQQKAIINTQVQTESEGGLPVLSVDYEKFAHYLDESNASEEQKRQLVETVWNITMMFVDMGFGVHPVQQAKNACGKRNKNSSTAALTAPVHVKCPHEKLNEEFYCIARGGDQ